MKITINEKTNTHLLFVCSSLFTTSHSYNQDLVVTGASASSCYFSGDELFLLAIFKVSLRLQP